jgi:peptidoglycan/LPS O-acetylase OafA/YrhL
MKSGHISYLDGWRGAAITSVFFGHFVQKGHYWWVGAFGVQLFFALSGFLMCNILFFKKAALPDFFARRLIRVAPTFVLFVLALTVYASTLQPVRYTPSPAEFFATLTFLRSYLPPGMNILNDDWPIAHLWSLNVEEHTYIFLALIAFFTRKMHSRLGTAAMLLAASLSALYFGLHYVRDPLPAGTSGTWRTEAASLGILAAVSLSYVRRTWPGSVLGRVHPFVPVISLLIGFACFTDHARWRGFDVYIAPLFLAFAIVYLDCVPAALLRVLSVGRLRWIGRISFSLYLWQQPFHFAVLHYGMNAWLAVSLALALGLVSFYGFEDPIRRMLTRRWEERRQKAASGSAVAFPVHPLPEPVIKE